jgi:hypothetical protein
MFQQCTSLKSLTFPKGIASIGYDALYGCTGLESITADDQNATYSSEDGILFNKGKTKIVFYPSGKKDTSYTLPSTVTSMETEVFQRNTHLTSVDLSSSGITEVAQYAFVSCTSLKTVSLSAKVTMIYISAFNWCTELETIKYAGTKSQWNSCSSTYKSFYYTGQTKGSFIVQCSDGNITKYTETP